MLTLSPSPGNNRVQHRLSPARLGFLILAIGLVGVLGACAGEPGPPSPTPSPATTPTPLPSATPTPISTPTATKVPAARALPTLSPEQARPYRNIQDMALACDELHPNRRRTVLQHMDWLTRPDEIPGQFLNLFGQNVQGELAFGAAYMVAVQWKLNGRPAESCLIPIGERLNTMVAVFGKEPVPEFGFAEP